MKKINISMGFLKPVQNFFKKYTALLPSIGIVIVAVLLLFPTMIMGNKLKKEMESSVSSATKVKTLLRDVPSKDEPDQIQRYMEQLKEQATEIERLMVQSSQRELISYNVFPPKSTSSQLYTDFGNKYRESITDMIRSMNALDAPSQAEISAQTGEVVRTPGQNRQSQVSEVNPMVDALCITRSQEISTYAHPSLFSWYEFWEDYDFQGEKQALQDCWDSQVAYWIYEDIAQTITRMNSGSQAVSSSPVKRLMGVSFTSTNFETNAGPIRGNMMALEARIGGGASSVVRDIPNYVVGPSTSTTQASVGTDSDILLYSVFVQDPLTKRKGDDEVDIVHFAFSVLVDNRFVMEFMKELCSEKTHTFRTDYKADGQVVNAIHNQISILQSDIKVVDKQAPAHQLYRYGKGAVMRLDLICEYQFIRKGYDSIKPAAIKERLGQTDDTQETNNSNRPS